MKRGLNTLSALACVLIMGSIASCDDNELELFAELEPVPVIYGMLEHLPDSVQYIRVERSIGDPEVGATTLAMDEDQVYFDDVTVRLTNNTLGQSTILERVNAVDRGYRRAAGDFLVDPNYVYVLEPQDLPLQARNSLTITLERADTVFASSNVALLDSAILRVPTLSMGLRTINFDTIQPTLIRWNGIESSDLFVLRYEMSIRERNSATGTDETNTYLWDITRLESIQQMSGSRRVDIDGNSFFGFIERTFDPNPDVIRQFVDGRLIIEGYGRELESYIEVINANAGITGAQEVPVFTNVEGGLGLFTSISRNVFNDVRISSATVNRMRELPGTRDLGFSQ